MYDGNKNREDGGIEGLAVKPRHFENWKILSERSLSEICRNMVSRYRLNLSLSLTATREQARLN